MQTYTTRRNRFGDLCNNSAAAVLTLADALMNASEKRIISSRDWDFLDRQYTLNTTADTFTVTIASPGVFSLTAHGFAIGTVVYFATTGALPTGLTVGTAYYIITAGFTADAFRVSTSINGSVVNTSGSQSGTHTVTTATYILPSYTKKPSSIYVTVGSYRYQPQEITTRSEWDRLNQTVITGDAATYYHIYDGMLLLYPKPATANSIVTINARRIARDLSIADYTTGTVDAVTVNSTAVTGSSTVWTAPMVGRWIRVTPSNTATAAGDGYWYEIAARTSDTAIVLRRPYGGDTLSAGAAAAYAIGEASLIPEPHDFLPIYDALKIYFTSVEPNTAKAQLYGVLFQEGYAQMVRDMGSTSSVVLEDGNEEDESRNPNFYVTL